MGIDPSWGVKTVPYGFYDVGVVWNDDQDQAARASGSSGGAGVKLLSDTGVSADFGVAFPLTREIDNPLQGNGKNPRYTMQVSYGF
jgi:hemolysin activation/secretion protein